MRYQIESNENHHVVVINGCVAFCVVGTRQEAFREIKEIELERVKAQGLHHNNSVVARILGISRIFNRSVH